jgi:hypothetical protein
MLSTRRLSGRFGCRSGGRRDGSRGGSGMMCVCVCLSESVSVTWKEGFGLARIWLA